MKEEAKKRKSVLVRENSKMCKSPEGVWNLYLRNWKQVNRTRG